MLRFKNKIISVLFNPPLLRYFKKNLFLLIFLIFPATLFSQVINFKNYSTKDGLPSNEVYQVIQDSKGYMWFATDFGVSRFDGYNFTNYNSKDGLEYVNTADIVKIEADGSYSNIFLANNKKNFSSKNLKEFQNILNK